MRRKQGWKGSLLPSQLAGAEQWGWGQGADVSPCQLMEWHCCPPEACWATNMSGFWGRNFEDSNLDKTICFRGVFKNKQLAHTCLLYTERIHLCLYARVSSEWLTSPEYILEKMYLLRCDVRWIEPLQVLVQLTVQPHHVGFSWHPVITPGQVGYLSSELLLRM